MLLVPRANKYEHAETDDQISSAMAIFHTLLIVPHIDVLPSTIGRMCIEGSQCISILSSSVCYNYKKSWAHRNGRPKTDIDRSLFDSVY